MKSKRTIPGRRMRFAKFIHCKNGTIIGKWVPVEWYTRSGNTMEQIIKKKYKRGIR